jgi:hypothetical protein
MNLSLIRRLGAALLLAAVAGHAAADDTIEQLRAENVRLRTQLQQLQQTCPVAAAPAASKAAAAAPAPAAPTPVPAPTPAAAANAVAPPAAVQVQPGASPASPAAVASVPVPAGYKLVPLSAPDYVDPLSPPYDHAGCSRDLFKGPVPAKWNEADNWLDVERGQNMADVEKSLGKEHFTAQGRGLVEWQYGKCGDHVAGRVLFQDGKVVSLQVPDLK